MEKLHSNDKELVNAVLSGSRNAFVDLIRRYERLVLHIVTPMIGVTDEREDLCQEVFIAVYEKLHTFQFKSKLSTWIGNIAYHRSINYRAKKKAIPFSRMTAGEDEEPFPGNKHYDADDAEQIYIRNEDLSRLAACIDALTEMQRMTVLLFYQDDMSLEEIGTTLEIPVNTVKSHLFRARRTLQQNLTQE